MAAIRLVYRENCYGFSTAHENARHLRGQAIKTVARRQSFLPPTLVTPQAIRVYLVETAHRGRLIFFHRSELRSGLQFDQQLQFRRVRFTVADGAKGPQAILIRPAD